jgi:alkylation response protein AidB-like acyl-CoA dehydrogenase
MPGLVQSKPLRKMGMHSSPTGELFLDDVRVGRDRLIGETEDVPAAATAPRPPSGRAHRRRGDGARHHRAVPRALGRVREDRVQFGKPIGEFQLIQLKLAKMEVARMNVQNLVFRTIELSKAGKR